MVAYSFKRRFVGPIKAGLDPASLDGRAVYVNSHLYNPKRQTIRADRARHARPGEELQLYCGMRTKGCFLIGRARCIAVRPITIWPTKRSLAVMLHGKLLGPRQIATFVRKDGFDDWRDMCGFWLAEHPDVVKFEGILIEWEPLT